ncbi:MAG: MlaD family protein [Methylomonas sp.]
MSKQANPLAIGAFLVGALILLALGIIIFGGSDFFKEKNRFVIFFDSALNGLNVGAPVKLQGVQIGNVSEISLIMDSESGRILKPVVIEIDPGLLRDISGQKSQVRTKKQLKEAAQRLIDAGLKARLETQSLLTGLLFVDLNFYHEKRVNLVNVNYKDLPELPNVPTTVDEIRNTVDEILNWARRLPLEDTLKNLTETMQEVHTLVRSDDTKKAIAALSKSMQETERLMVTLNGQVGPLIGNVNNTLAETRGSLQDFNRELLPVLKAAEQSLITATRVLQESDNTLNAVGAMTTPDSQLGQALVEIHNAARSLKDLTDSLERHPEAIIYGK